MLENRQILAYDDPSKTFLGVRFVLFGFDPDKKEKVRFKLLEGGGTDAVNYGPDCNHVIVDKLVDDDPVCVAARRDGKILVTGLWVDHSFDLGMPVDPTSVMYRTMRDLNGIPGAKHLVVCLTGYQRQDREDIMTMVALMGANFSKPLVANKVTHLICYKFEGEKYELAKKMKKIKLINHCWLEDCLKAWELRPEADYSKSGQELEMEAEAQAKDSEGETEDVAPIMDMGRKNAVSPQNRRLGISHQSPMKLDISTNKLYSSASKSLTNHGESSGRILSTPGKETNFGKASSSLETCNKHLETKIPSSGRSPGDISSELPPKDMLDSTEISEKVENVLALKSESAKKSPDSNSSKLSSKSFHGNTTRKSTLPLTLERVNNNSGSPSTSGTPNRGVNDDLGMPVDRQKDGTDPEGIKTPLKRTPPPIDEGQTVLSNKRTTLSRHSSKSSKLMEPEKASYISPAAVAYCLREEEASWSPEEALKTSLTSEARHKGNDQVLQHSGSKKRTLPKVDANNLSPTRADLGSIPRASAACALREEEASLGPKETLETSLTPEDRHKGNDRVTHSLSKGLKKKTSSRTDLESIEPPFPRTISSVENTDGQDGSNLPKVGPTGTVIKPIKKKLHTKKTLGARPTISKKVKDSVNIQKTVLQTEDMLRSNPTMTEKAAVVTPTTDEDGAVHDKAKASKDKRGRKKAKSVEVEAPQYGEAVVRSTIQADSKTTAMAKSVGGKSSTEAESAGPNNETDLAESKSANNGGEKKPTKAKKRLLSKSKTSVLKESSEGVKMNGGQDETEAVSGNKEAAVLAGKTKKRPSKKLKSSCDVEKENNPAIIEQQSVSNDAGEAVEGALQQLRKPLNKVTKADKENESQENVEVKSEPACFILSGHRLQRKEFQQVIKRLKGRVCRDSHHWSYQATHFIVPDPVRRTEKFFAAAASGSWILKTDYLAASNEAGRFLSEEPYEWHKKCLTEDGAINLEAPRKWRLLRERTGHGAFYGMRIVIYGECIAPPLDTLKRVVKAGDGTILATSPPYTRFLQSGIDFAVISPGMPRVDMWVQEFLRHEVPCVVADYLVEYVCKPGYPLERHVQYNTHSWAKKSLENLVTHMEEIAEDPETPDDGAVDDVACRACGSRDRGEEMIICGNEHGSVGCGVGVHIDCLDPPLEDVPKEDWYCSDCTQKSKSCSKKRASKSNK